jgi:cytochrome c1
MRRLVSLGCVLTLLTCAGCTKQEKRAREEAIELTGGDPDRGIIALSRYGCVSCHTIPGVRQADATVGPPLTAIASRGYLAGRLSNSPENLMKWIQHPQQVDPGNAMPEMHVSDQDAHDIAAYLYTLR